jgi:hypothetical protein
MLFETSTVDMSARPVENARDNLMKKVFEKRSVDLMKLLDGIVEKRVGKGAALLLAQLFASGSRGKCHRDRHAPSHAQKETIIT